jgi:spore germination protein GerM
MTTRVVGAAALILALGACGGTDETVTIYLAQRLGPEGPPGQIVPVLMPVERERRDRMSAAYQAVLAIRQGPGPGEWGEGFVETIRPETRLRGVRVAGGTATVDLAGRPTDLYGTAAIVYSLTELDGVRAVRLRLDGRPCCAYTLSGEVDSRPLTRTSYRGWPGYPCALRTGPDTPRC